jgi:hypothetical protein
MRRPALTPAQQLHADWLLRGEIEGHTLAENLEHFRRMAELEDLEQQGRAPDGLPAWIISPAVEETGLRRLFHRRPG